VVPFHEDSWDVGEREAVWLLIEWPDGEKQPTKFRFATLHPNTTKKKLVRIVKDRYRTERVYKDFKGEWDSTTSKGAAFAAGITTSRSPSAATPSSSPNAFSASPPFSRRQKAAHPRARGLNATSMIPSRPHASPRKLSSGVRQSSFEITEQGLLS
jgi:hypothetical protein